MYRPVHFEIQADNIERAIKFYNNVFGWNIVKFMTKESSGMMDYWMIDTGKGEGINGGMHHRPKSKEEKIFLLSFTIDVLDIDKTIKDVKNNGGKVNMDKSFLKGVGWFVRVTDSENNQFSLMQAVK